MNNTHRYIYTSSYQFLSFFIRKIRQRMARHNQRDLPTQKSSLSTSIRLHLYRTRAHTSKPTEPWVVQMEESN